jgi:DNA-binding LacI/PurR family transcriptional regulator
MRRKRVTIYDLAKALGFSASYISKALNDHPSIRPKLKEAVRKKALELNYKHNSHAANLRQGSSKTIGVIVPHINQSFFSDAIAGIEEVSSENNHSLIICQSHESYIRERKTVDTLIHQNVDCILISVSAETQSYDHLDNIQKHNIHLIQFDRYLDKVDSFKISNDNKEASYSATKTLFEQGYKRVAFLGGPDHTIIFKLRKEGFLMALKESRLSIPYNFIVEDSLDQNKTIEVVTELLDLENPPDAFLTVSDHQSLTILKVAESKGINVPLQLGIFGFANEAFSSIIKPSLSSVDQKSKELGKRAAKIYFENILKGNNTATKNREEIIKSEIIVRESTMRIKAITAPIPNLHNEKI